jgi:tetratricopeptide (TPR) repeat protein
LRGFVEVGRGRWEEAIPFFEKAIKYNPKAKTAYRNLSMAYANVGRTQEARAMLDRGTEGWPKAMKTLRSFMVMVLFKNPQIRERLAEGILKAGMPGEPSGYYKISTERKLTEAEIRKLFFGRKVTGFDPLTQKQWWIERTEEGKAAIRGSEGSDSGKSWIEDDMLCDQWDNLFEGLKDCYVVYRNPEWTPEKNDEYLGASFGGIAPFSQVE